MRASLPFVMVVLMTIFAETQTLPAPPAITDPKQVSSKPNAEVERSLTIEQLYMTRQVSSPAWSPDGKSIAFISNISGRNNLWLVPSEGGWPTQLTVSNERQTAPAWRWCSWRLRAARRPEVEHIFSVGCVGHPTGSA